jgi:hypothetical protein
MEQIVTFLKKVPNSRDTLDLARRGATIFARTIGTVLRTRLVTILSQHVAGCCTHRIDVLPMDRSEPGEHDKQRKDTSQSHAPHEEKSPDIKSAPAESRVLMVYLHTNLARGELRSFMRFHPFLVVGT